MFSNLINRANEEDPDYWTDGRDRHREYAPKWKWYHFLLAAVILFPYIAIFVLFGLVAEKDNTSSQGVSHSITSLKLVDADSAVLSSGRAVSLNVDGEAQQGGGTSIYKSIVDLSFTCPSYIDVDAMFDDLYLVSYSDDSSATSSFVVVQVAPAEPNQGIEVSNTPSGYFVYQTTVLSQTSGVFVSICQDFDPTAEEAYVVAGSLSDSTFVVTQGDPVEYTTLYSVNPSITKLDDSTFAISYFTSEAPYEVVTRYGTVNPTTLEVILSDSVSYASNADFGTYATIVGMSSSQYLLMFYDAYDKSTGSYVAPGPLNVIVSTIPGGDGTAKPTLGATVTLDDVNVKVYFQATAVSNTTAVVAYSDASSNNGLRAQAITLDSTLTSVLPGASWLVASGEALVALDNSTLCDLDIQTISNNGEFMVLYTDASNGGSVTATSGALTISGEIVSASPSFVLSTPSGGSYTWGALSAGDKTPWGSRVAILTSETVTGCVDTEASTMFSFMEVKPAPLGIVSKTNGGSSATVVISGAAEPILMNKQNLVLGMSYYTNSMGYILPGNVFYGRSATGSVSSGFGNADMYYIYDEESNTIVSLNARVGVAISSAELLVTPAAV